MKKILFIIFITVFVLSLNALGTLRVESIKELPTTHMNLEVRDADGKYAPVLIVKTELKGLGFQNVSRPTKYAAKYIEGDHHYKFYMNDNQRVIKITHSDYEPLEVRLLADYSIEVKAQRVYEMVLEYDQKKIQIASIGKGNLTITTEPSGANVKIEEYPDFDKQTPCKLNNYPAITYHFNISKFRYALVDTVFSIEEKESKVEHIKLKPLWGDITITSEPSGAEIFINDELRGNTPFNLKGIDNGLDEGKYKIYINHPSDLYSSTEVGIKISNNTILKKHFIFEDLSGSIKINVSPKPLNVYINGEYDDDLSLGKEKRFRNGNYNIEIKKKGIHHNSYITINKKITLSKNGYIEIIDKLVEKTGNILISSNIEKTEFTIIDTETNSEIFEKTLQDSFKVLTGKYKVIADSPNKQYFSKSKEIVVKENEKSLINFQLEKSKEIVINSNPSGAKLFINNKYVGTTPHNIVMESKKNKIKLEIDNFYSYFKVISLNSTRTNYTVNLKKKSSFWLSSIFSPDNLSFEFSYLRNKSIYTVGYWNFKDKRNIPDYVDYTDIDRYPDISPISHKVDTYSKWNWGLYYKQGFTKGFPFPYILNIGLGWVYKTLYPIFEAEEGTYLLDIQAGDYWTTEETFYYNEYWDYKHYFPIILGVSVPISNFVIHLDYLTTFGAIKTLNYGLGIAF
ncbi:MAG: PEGA domain-containing protein [Candidatus Cloacimonetes bacterium]|nr:PEGA domain-containing protein [Candidatus Cloacimonadota bacterium]